MISFECLEIGIDSSTNVLRIVTEDSRSIRTHFHTKLGDQKDLIPQSARIVTVSLGLAKLITLPGTFEPLAD